MLIPLRPGELQRLIPAVATGNQFRFALGNPQEVLQRLMIAAIGGVITFLIYNQAQLGSRWGPVWLVISVVFFLYVLWGPIVQAGQRNATLRRYPAAALFEGEVADVITRERVENRHEQADSRGRLELVENRRTWMLLELEDEEGYLGRVAFPMEKEAPVDPPRQPDPLPGAERAQGFLKDRSPQRCLAAGHADVGWRVPLPAPSRL